jgi:hypothetical protein
MVIFMQRVHVKAGGIIAKSRTKMHGPRDQGRGSLPEELLIMAEIMAVYGGRLSGVVGWGDNGRVEHPWCG